MHVTESGSGTPLVLLHAFPFDARMWDRVVIGLASRVRVIMPDLRGFGRTPLAGEPDLEVLARDVVAMLDELGLDRVVLGGCSMGGYVAMGVLRLASRRVAGLVLIDTRSAADPLPAKENRFAMADRVEREGVAWLPEELAAALLGATTVARRADVVATVRRFMGAAPAASVAWAQRAMAGRPDSAATLRAMDIPALIVHGAEDTLIPPDSAHALAELLPRAEVVILPDAGHLPPLEVPADVTAAIANWLARNGF
jgi:pimeloyl-ACP methyl ester carboxylesterase